MPNLDHIDPGNSGGSVAIPELKKFKPAPVTYPCTDCERVFDDIEALRSHRLEVHPIHRPYLYLATIPHHLSRYVVTGELRPADLHFVDAEKIYVNGNLAPDQNTAAASICARQTGRTELELVNSGYPVRYILDFDIISADVASSVEKALLWSHQKGSTSADGLRLFNDAVQKLDSSARGYAGALDRYLVGIMAKDRAPGCQIPYEEYSEKLGEAMDRLRHIRRPISEAVISLIQLVLNNFNPAPLDLEVPLLAATKAALREGSFSELGRDSAGEAAIPVDYITELAMLFATAGDEYRRNNFAELESLVLSSRLSEDDHIKFRLLLMTYYGETQNLQKLREHYSKVRHVRQVGDYARSIYERFDK